MEAQCKDGVRDDGVVSLIVVAGERRGSLGVGFENMMCFHLTCKRGSVGQSEGLPLTRSSVRFRLKPDNSNSHEFELHRPSNKGTKLLLKVIKAIIITWVKK